VHGAVDRGRRDVPAPLTGGPRKPGPTAKERIVDQLDGAWTAELDRRLRDFDEGRTKAVPYEEAMAQVRARLASTPRSGAPRASLNAG